MEQEKNGEIHRALHRVMLVVAYDGTKYHGWQFQPNAVTVEGKLNQALCALTGENIQVIGASRTDAGVHAMCNIAVFDTSSRIPPEKFSHALNQRLPEDIVIQASEQVAMNFHPRHCDTEKTYEYSIVNRRFPLPEYRNTAYFYYGKLDLQAMQQACYYFLGEHDFASFCSAGAQVKSTVRTIYELEVTEKPLPLALVKPESTVQGKKEDSEQEWSRQITIRIRGNGFLYNMVRIIAGTLMEVGKGTIRPGEMEDIIASADRANAGPTAPPQGLKLVKIDFAASCQA